MADITTQFITTRKEVYEELSCPCKRPTKQAVAGNLRYYPNWYEKELAGKIASSVILGIYEKGAENEVDVLLTEESVNDIETAEFKELMNELRTKFPKEVIREVAKLHNQLGHPAPNKLAEALIDAKKPKEYSACARLFVCENCLRRKEPGLFRVAALPKASHFN